MDMLMFESATETVFCEPGGQAHYDWLLDHRRKVEAGELPHPTATPESIARHEAAHTVVAVLLDARFDEMVVLPVSQWRRDHAAGAARAFAPGFTVEDAYTRGCAILWAGAVIDGHLYGSGADIATIVGGTVKLPEAKQGVPFSMAAMLVAQQRPIIDAVAARLVPGPDTPARLSYRECAALVWSMLPAGAVPPWAH